MFTLELHSNGRLRPAVEAEPGYRVHACKCFMHDCEEVVTRVDVIRKRGAESWSLFNVKKTGIGIPVLCTCVVVKKIFHGSTKHRNCNCAPRSPIAQHELVVSHARKNSHGGKNMEDSLIDLIV